MYKIDNGVLKSINRFTAKGEFSFSICTRLFIAVFLSLFDYRTTRPDTRHKMRRVCVPFTFENNTGHTDRRTDGRTDGRTDRRTDGRTDTTSYRDATVHLKRQRSDIMTNLQQIQWRKKRKCRHRKGNERHGAFRWKVRRFKLALC